jgi:choloylglycine hydrolase
MLVSFEKNLKILIAAVALLVSNYSFACTRAVYIGPQNTVLTGRSMDWVTTAGTNLWAFQKGMKRNGAAGTNSIEWQSKYSSIVASFFDAASVDGINEKGLVTNVLYLAESKYPDPKTQGNRKRISIAAWGQFVLDNFATVSEVVDALSKEPFYVVQVTTPDGHPGTGHLAVSDPSGDSAIFEYVDGKLMIHHSKKYQVMTNSPTFDQQLAINDYWIDVGGTAMLPGTARAADRFVRASYYTYSLPQTADLVMATAGIFSVIRNASAPFGVAEPGKPNISATLWRSVSDQKNLVYYYENTSTPNVFWIEFKDLKFAEGKSSLTLKVNEGQVYAGNTADKFTPAEPFAFLVAS